MGRLSEKPFLQACLRKFVRKEAEASQLCTFWQEQLMNQSGISSTLGSWRHLWDMTLSYKDCGLNGGKRYTKALVNGFMDMKECGRLSDVKEDRKVTRMHQWTNCVFETSNVILYREPRDSALAGEQWLVSGVTPRGSEYWMFSHRVLFIRNTTPGIVH